MREIGEEFEISSLYNCMGSSTIHTNSKHRRGMRIFRRVGRNNENNCL
jgi:hypothetical protein